MCKLIVKQNKCITISFMPIIAIWVGLRAQIARRYIQTKQLYKTQIQTRCKALYHRRRTRCIHRLARILIAWILCSKRAFKTNWLQNKWQRPQTHIWMVSTTTTSNSNSNHNQVQAVIHMKCISKSKIILLMGKLNKRKTICRNHKWLTLEENRPQVMSNLKLMIGRVAPASSW